MKAQNIFLDENTGGKGRYFKSRFLQPGLVKYTFGVCVLDKATIDKFIQGFVGCPVIIGHKDVTNASAKDDRVGVISRIWYDETDGWFWGEGIIFDEKAISLVESGYNVSCQYDITEYSNNTTKALHNGNPYDKVILNGKPEHLAIVENPRYENAMIAVNALDLTAENEEHWITIGGGDDTKGRHVLVRDGETHKEAAERKVKEWEEKGKESGDNTSKSFEDKGFKKAEEKGAGNRWHLKKDGKMHTIVQTTGDKFRYNVAEWDDEKGGGKELFDKTSLSKDELNEYIKDISDTKAGKDLYSDENFKYNAKRLNEQFGTDKGYSEWQKDVQTLLKKYGKTEEDFDNAIGARKDAFKQSDTKDGKIEAKEHSKEWHEQRYNNRINALKLMATQIKESSDYNAEHARDTIQKLLKSNQFSSYKYDINKEDFIKEGHGDALAYIGQIYGKENGDRNKKQDAGFKLLQEIVRQDLSNQEKEWLGIKSDTKEERIEARRKHQEVVKKHNQAYKDFEDGKISMEELDKADKELEKSNKEFYGTSDTKDKQSDTNSNNYLYNKAKEIGDNKPQLLKRLKEGLGVLNPEYKKEFKEYELDFENKRLKSKTSDYVLQWENNGRTSAGSVSLRKPKSSDKAKNTIIQAINEIKDNNMFRKLFNLKKEKTTMEKDEMKALFIDCIQDVLKAQNEEDIEDVEFEEDEEKAENKKCRNKKCKNEDVDKRKLIDEVAGIMKSAGCDDEVIRTAIAKMEKIGYDKSEAATADNGKKAKCEDEEDLEDAKNKAKNSIDELKGFLASAGVNKSASKYVTKAQAIELGNQLF